MHLKEKQGGWFAVPFASYSPETEWAFGAAGLFYFYMDNEASNTSRLSNLLPSVEFTTKKQMTIELEHDIYLNNSEYRFYGNLGFAKFPFSFYGIGNNTLEENEESYTARYFYIESTFIKNFIPDKGSGLNAGIKYEFRSDKLIKKKPGGLLSSRNIWGNSGGIISGLGIIVNWDTRDNTFSTFSGEYIEINGSFFGKYLFSDYIYNSYNLDARKYFNFPVFDTLHIAAFQFAANLTSGRPPFYKLATFGGDENMRGIFQGRFRDNTSFYLQGEYRFHIIWRIGMAAFAGLGEAANKITSFAINQLKTAYGIGFRFFVIPDEKILARLDFGFSKGEGQMYLSFNEAF
ncbi:MAG: hypothetical protein EHM47_18775 [Ignavibacteriales bacterium]|nr:MAG: hypothetical protein EHM47_18775 [Ignavibacteriales bacterium]